MVANKRRTVHAILLPFPFAEMKVAREKNSVFIAKLSPGDYDAGDSRSIHTVLS